MNKCTGIEEKLIFTVDGAVDGVNCMHLLPLLPAVLPRGMPEKDKTS